MDRSRTLEAQAKALAKYMGLKWTIEMEDDTGIMIDGTFLIAETESGELNILMLIDIPATYEEPRTVKEAELGNYPSMKDVFQRIFDIEASESYSAQQTYLN